MVGRGQKLRKGCPEDPLIGWSSRREGDAIVSASGTEFRSDGCEDDGASAIACRSGRLHENQLPGSRGDGGAGLRASRPVSLLTSNVFEQGHRIRVQISGSFFPNFSRNLQSGELENDSAKLKKATISIYLDPDHPSEIVLPVVSRAR